MQAMVLPAAGRPLQAVHRPPLQADEQSVVIQVRACGVCRTDLHVIDGDLPLARFPLVLGHQVVGTVMSGDPQRTGFVWGERVGLPWLARTCGRCRFCQGGRENLCEAADFTGYTVDGGFAQQVLADPRYLVRLPSWLEDDEAAPLLCAGLIGFRALRLAGDAERIGIYGFGAAGHLICQMAAQQGREVFAFTRPGDTHTQEFARTCGASWAGGSDVRAPMPLDAALLFAPVGALVPKSLADVDKGGVVVCAGIHMSDIPRFPYALLWQERVLRSVANLTREDAVDFFATLPRLSVKPRVTCFPLARANEALEALRNGTVDGSVVLDVRPPTEPVPCCNT